VYFAFGADEETGGKYGAKSIADTLAQQGLKFDLILDEGCTFQEIDCDGRTYSAAFIGMGEKQQCEYLITVTCPGGHTSQPHRTTAVGILSEAICRVESAQPHHRMIPLVRQHLDRAISTFSFGKRFVVANKPLFGLLVSLVFRDDPYVMSLIRTTIVPTRVDGNFPAANVLPGVASARLNARLLPGDTPEKILSELQELLADLPLTVELVSEWEPSELTSEETPMYRLLCDVIQQAHPRLPCIPTLMNSTGDARHYAQLSDCTLRFAPLVTGQSAGSGSHEGDEFLAEKSLGVAVELYRDLMKKL
jgi:carboxypeptidase PM20D1